MKIQVVFKTMVWASLALMAGVLLATHGHPNGAGTVQAAAVRALEMQVFDPRYAPLAQTTICSDTYEPNNSLTTFSGPFSISTGGYTSVPNLTLSRSGGSADQDFFGVNVINGYFYTVTASPGSSLLGVRVVLYDSSSSWVTEYTGGMGSPVVISWWAPSNGTYKVQITASNPGTFDPCLANNDYDLLIERSTASATATATPTSTSTATKTSTPTLTPTGGTYLTDTLEGTVSNNSFANAADVSVGVSYNHLTFYWNYPDAADVDYYRVWAKGGHKYQIEIDVGAGLDSYIEVYDSAYNLVTYNDDRTVGELGSLAVWQMGAATDWYYIKVSNKDPSNPTNKVYTMKVSDITPVETSTPTATTQSSCALDAFDAQGSNDTPGAASIVQVGAQYSNLTFSDNASASYADVDYYTVWGKTEWGRYQVETSGWDTLVIVYGPSPAAGDAGPELGRNDDKAYNDTGSRVAWTATSDGWYTIKVDRSQGARLLPGCGKYVLEVVALSVSPSKTPTTEPTSVGATPVTGYDRYEPNFDFDHATTIALGSTYDLNFVPYLPWEGHWEDNDFFKLYVKPGLLLTCETYDLSTGTDTNMILYNNDRQGIAGNDDVDTASGKFESRVSFFSTYTGWLYILVGQGHAVALPDARNYSYKMRCLIGTQPSATPTLTPEPLPTYAPYPTPLPTPIPPPPTLTPPPTLSPAPTPVDTPTPTITPTPLPPVQVVALATPTLPGPMRQTVTVELSVFYDSNENNQPDTGEGIIGLQALAYDQSDGALLTQSFTDDAGRAILSVAAMGSVRVLVPYLGFEAVVPDGGGALQVRISPRQLPSLIP